LTSLRDNKEPAAYDSPSRKPARSFVIDFLSATSFQDLTTAFFFLLLQSPSSKSASSAPSTQQRAIAE